jgi:hypothetical protein
MGRPGRPEDDPHTDIEDIWEEFEFQSRITENLPISITPWAFLVAKVDSLTETWLLRLLSSWCTTRMNCHIFKLCIYWTKFR